VGEGENSLGGTTDDLGGWAGRPRAGWHEICYHRNVGNNFAIIMYGLYFGTARNCRVLPSETKSEAPYRAYTYVIIPCFLARILVFYLFANAIATCCIYVGICYARLLYITLIME